MEAAPITDETRTRLNAIFTASDRAEAEGLLVEECGRNLPFCTDSTPGSLDRLRFAALKLSGGDLDELVKAIELAQVDWRDLLMAAGFGEDVEAHRRWHP